MTLKGADQAEIAERAQMPHRDRQMNTVTSVVTIDPKRPPRLPVEAEPIETQGDPAKGPAENEAAAESSRST